MGDSVSLPTMTMITHAQKQTRKRVERAKPRRRALTAVEALRKAATTRSGFSHEELGALCDPPVSRQAVGLVMVGRQRSRCNQIEETIAAVCAKAMRWPSIEDALDRLGWRPTPRQQGNQLSRTLTEKLEK